MSMVRLADICSHLQNASRARLGFTSIPNSQFHLKLVLALQGSGFISTVVRGGKTPPPAHNLLSHPASNAEGAEIEPITRENVASRRAVVGHEILEQRTRVGKDVTGQQTYKEAMDGCGGTPKDSSGQAEWLCERLDENLGSVCTSVPTKAYLKLGNA